MSNRRAVTSLLANLRRAATASLLPSSSPASFATTMLFARGAAAASASSSSSRSAAAAASSSSSSPPSRPSRRKPAGYVWNELMFWHNPGEIGDLATRVQPTRHLEHAETKRRLHNLVALSGLLQASSPPSPSPSPSGGGGGGGGAGAGGERRRQAGPALVEIEPRMALIKELER
jgi:hypothetical protein